MTRHTTLVLTLFAAALMLAALPTHAALIGYYSFDDGTASDGSGTGNNGTAGSNVNFSGADVPFGAGQAAFTGTGGGSTRVITVPTSPTLEGINHTFTVSFWMKATTANNGNWVRIFQHGTEANGAQTWLIDRFTSSAKTNMRVDTVDDPGPPFVDGQFNQNIATGGPDTFDSTWHHLVYSIDTGTYAKYTDTGVTTGTYKRGLGLANTRPLYIFGRNGVGQYVGLLDDIGIWDNALTQAEAHAIYNLAMEPALAYGAGNAQTLFDLFAAGSGVADIGGDFWKNTSGLSGSPGDVVHVNGRHYGLVLDAAGNGLVMVPEPGTLIIWSLLAAMGIGVAWRRRKG